MRKRRTLKRKVQVYESFLHQLQMYAEVSMDGEKVAALIRNACRWSYAHRSGNGELSERQQTERINAAFDRLLDTK